MTTKQLHQKTHHFVLLFLLLCVVGLTKSYAYDFSAVCETGQTLYYNITNAVYHYVELTHPGSYMWNGYDEPVGDIILPRYVYDADDNQYLVTSIGSNAFSDCYGLTSITIPNSVTSIDGSTFDGCYGLTSITIPNSVTSIGDQAFYHCYGLTSLTIGNSVTTIGWLAFSKCSGLTSITIPNSVTSIGSSAFSLCTGLTSITIPNSVTSIGQSPFSGCSGIEEILVESGNTVYDSRDNSNAIIRTSANELVQGCKNTVIPNSVISINTDAFSYCTGLTSIDIPNSVISIRDYAFRSCTSLTSIEIPSSVAWMSGLAFSGCSGIEEILVESGNTVYDSRGNCNAIIHTSTNELIIGCKNTIIPNSVTSIGSYAFQGCSGLTSITIPNSVTSIGQKAFYGCNGLSSSIMMSITPPTLEFSDAFSATNNTLRIYVPYESLEVYKTAPNWSSYQAIIFPWVKKSISGYGTGNGGWYFIASPLLSSVAPTEINGMIQEQDYDLYRFNQSAEAEWENYKNPIHTQEFTINNGKGYLYASKEDVNVIFKGTFNEFDERMVSLTYDSNAGFAGWNLVGNPFPVNAYGNKSYYVMNEDGTAIEPVAVSMETAIPPCTGIMVRAEMTGQSVTFTKESRQVSNNNGTLQIAVAQTNTRSNAVQDKTIISFNEEDQLEKFVFNKDNAKLYIPQGNADYAIAYAEKQGEMPLNFEAKESGSYTISVNSESVEMNYMHLIDNMTGTDVDLLATPSYTFESKTSDYASRFRLVFSAGGDTNDENEEPFAFVSNGNIIVTVEYANATLQIVDMLGHVVVNTDVAHNVSTNGIASGVYVLRLINGNDVKTQKIVVR